MLSFTCSPPGSFVYTSFGHFLSPDEDHVVIVRPHSISYFQISQIYESSDPDVELPFEATIIGAYKFMIPSRQTSSIALITRDLILVVLSSPENSDDDVPIERTICDQIRCTHVIPSKYSPIFASSGNDLYISVYPNSLCVVTITDRLDKNEVHFNKFLPRFLFGDEWFVYAFDLADNSLKLIGSDRIPKAIEDQMADSSDDVFIEKSVVEGSVDYFYYFNKNKLLFFKEKMIVFDDGKPQASYDLQNDSGVIGVSDNNKNKLFISFANGQFGAFDFDSKSFTCLANLAPFTNITFIDSDNILLSSPTEIPIIFSENSKSVKFIFSENLINSSTHLVLPHTIPDLDRLLVAQKNEIFLYGYGFSYTPESITEINGDRLFVCDKYVIITKNDKTTFLVDFQEAETQFISDQPTIYFYKYEKWYVQFCANSIIALDDQNNKVSLDIQIQHATSYKDTIAVASNASIKILKFDGASFHEVSNIEVGDEISSLKICKEKFLIYSLWQNLNIFVFNIETCERLSEFNSSQFESKFVIRSICPSSDHVYFGTSRGDILCTSLNTETGILSEICRARISTSNVYLSSITINDHQYVCASSDFTYLIDIDSENNNLILYPTSFGPSRVVTQNYTSSSNESSNKIYILNSTGAGCGEFQESKIIKIAKTTLDESIISLLYANVNGSNFIICLMKDKLVALDAITCDVAHRINLEPDYSYMNCTQFNIYEDTIIGICAASHVVNQNKISGTGKIIFIKNLTSILDVVIETALIPTAIAFSNGSLFIASGSELIKYSITNDLQFTFIKKAPGIMLASKLLIHNDHLVLIDAFKSVSTYDFELHQISIDFLAKYLITGCSIPDSENERYLVTDSYGNIYILGVEGEKIKTLSRANINDTITSITQWNPLPNLDNNKHYFCGTTSIGSIIIFLIGIDQSIFNKMERLQTGMEQYLVQNGELSHHNYRSLYSPSYRESYIKYIDINFLMGYQDFEKEDSTKLFADNQINDNDISEIQSIIEDIEKFTI